MSDVAAVRSRAPSISSSGSWVGRASVWSWRHTVLFAVTLAALAALPLTVKHWPSQDGQNHLAVAHVLLHYGDPGSPFPAYVSIQQGLRPSTALYSILCLLARWMPLSVAERGLVSAGIALLPLSLLLLVRRTLPRRSLAVFLGLPFATGWAFGMGFLSFQLSIAFGVFALALGWSPEGAPRGRTVFGIGPWHPLAALCYVVCVWFHPVAAALIGLAFLLLEWRRVLSFAEWPRLAAVVAPGVIFFAITYFNADASAAQTNTVPLETNWSDPASLIGAIFDQHVAFSPLELVPRVLAAGVLGVFAYRDLRARWGAGLRGAWPFGAGAEGGLARTFLVFFALYFVLPNAFRGWFYCSTRFLLFATFLLPALAEIPPRLLRRIPAWGVALSAVVLGVQLPEVLHGSRQMEDIEAVGAALPRGAKVIPMDFMDYLTAVLGPKPLGHAWAELVVERDAMASQLFAAGKPRMGGERFRTLSFHPGLLDPAGALPWSTHETWVEEARNCGGGLTPRCEELLRAREETLEAAADKYDYVLMIDPPEYAKSILAGRLSLRAHEGSAWLYSIVPAGSPEPARSASAARTK
ncbi:MAG TPA: hypothetical protein VGI39_38660 [Polyangiaceae bacterium]|jgi:hypothetical protein